MRITLFIWPPKADKSAMGAINRPLRLSGFICSSALQIGFLHEGNLGHICRVALTFAQFRNTCITTWTTLIAWCQFIEHLLDDQLVWQCAENTAAGAQFNNH